MTATFLAPNNGATKFVHRPTHLYVGKQVLLSRVYHPTSARHDLGVLGGHQDFPGFTVGESVHYGPTAEEQTSEVVRINSTCNFGSVTVVRFHTTTGSIYELIVLGN